MLGREGDESALLGGSGLRSRRRARDKERRRKRAAAAGVRSKEPPPEVARLLGDANLAYMQNKCGAAPGLCMRAVAVSLDQPGWWWYCTT